MCLQCRGSWQDPQNVVQLLQCYLRAAELEMRTAEEPLRSNLDVKGLKVQMLGRIEELGAQERLSGVCMPRSYALRGRLYALCVVARALRPDPTPNLP